ncbi:MAG: amidohydrolase [Bacillota bacterium]|nr:amidohydrolase [Bacillota bacterium]
MDFLKMAKEIEKEIIDIRRDIHKNPELDFDLFKTRDKIISILKEENIEYKIYAKTGIKAVIYGNGDKTVALRTDMDALPINEETGCDFSSNSSGKMHACGHDAHMAIALGALKILNKIKDKLSGNVVFIFEPAEETTGGSKIMINEGVLENPKVDSIFGLHVNENIDSGKIGYKKGVIMAASNPFSIKITGKGGHGAHPEATIDPIVIAGQFISFLQTIVSREINPNSGAVVTIGMIQGGTAENIIPESVNIKGILRSLGNEDREYLKKRLEDILSGVTSAGRGSYELKIYESYPCLYNDDTQVDNVVTAAREIAGADNVIELKEPSLGVESFSYFSQKIPAAFYFLGIRNIEKGIIYPTHNSKFNIDEKALAIGAAVQSKIAYDYLKEK